MIVNVVIRLLILRRSGRNRRSEAEPVATAMAPDPNVLCPVACNMCPVGSSDGGNDGASGIGGAGGVKRNGAGVTGGNMLVVQAGATHVSTLVVPLPFLLSQQDLVSVSPPTPHTEMGNRTGSACALGHWHRLIVPLVCPAVGCVRPSPDTENSTESSLLCFTFRSGLRRRTKQLLTASSAR